MFYPKSPFLKNQLVESQLFSRNSQQEIKVLMKWLCQTPSVTTYRINLQQCSFENFKFELELVLTKKYNCFPKIFAVKGIPEVICISPFDNVSKMPSMGLKEIMVDISCGAALLRGAHIFAPGVLSMQSGTKIGEKVNVFVDIEGKCKKGTNTIFESDQEHKIFIGTGDVKMQRFELFGPPDQIVNHGIAVEMNSIISGVPSIGDQSSNRGLLQNFPSIVCVRVLDPKPGETILDMCSAPGNKTTHIAELMGDSGTVIALDKHDKKIEMVRQKIKMYDFKSVKVFAYDSRKVLDTKTFDKEQTEINQPPFTACSFDRILLDAPCSGLGNRPLLKSNLTPGMLKSYTNVQRSLFKSAVGLLKPNGILVYSTCSISVEENEGVVKWALETFHNIKLVSADPLYGGEGSMDLSQEERKFVQRFGPANLNRGSSVDSIGFFIARFLKIE